MRGREAVTPTAHYTGYVWVRNGLSHPALATTEGRILFASVAPVATASRLLGGATLESYLLARHRAIDVLLDRAIEHDRISLVIELAAGLSPRGWRYVKRYDDRITYIEADLPEMAARKRHALGRIGPLPKRHRVVTIDALREYGDESLEGLVGQLDRDQGVAIITEGLLSYLSPLEVDALWRRLARILSGFAQGRYISDLYLGASQTWQVRAFRVLLSVFVRGPVYVHFGGAEEAISAVLSAGFAGARVERASELAGGAGDPGASLAHILEASTA
jgi:O-methyltransferase involved in polyketide biosynthesis